MARKDGLPEVGDLQALPDRAKTITPKTGDKHLEPHKGLKETYTDGNGKAVLEAPSQKHHVINNRTYNESDFLKRLARTEVDGKPLYEQRNFDKNGIHLPSIDADAVLTGAAKHKGGDATHAQYNDFVKARVGEIERAANDRADALKAEGLDAESRYEHR